jgi:hypothetical protein
VQHQDSVRDIPPGETARSALTKGTVRTLRQQEELPLLRDHLLRLDRGSRYERFNGFLDDGSIERYAAKCTGDGTVIIAYLKNGIVRGAAELHPPDQSSGAMPEIAFSVEVDVRRLGVGSTLFRRLIDEARLKGYRSLRITTGAQNHAMRALARKFGAKLTFRQGESSGIIALAPQPHFEIAKLAVTPADAAHAMLQFNRAWWTMFLEMYGWGRAA